ncbi:MAG: FliM/FliN family flagellar motor C-terminal domain-containing protein [Hyphomonas sp.]
MSSVLRKKMGTGSGLPPTILRYHDFWSAVHHSLLTWAGESLDGGVPQEPEMRRVYTGTAALEALERRTAFFFNSRVSPGLCAIAADGAGAARIVAKRLSQDFESAKEASALFLKLMFEAPAVSLWRSAAASLEGHQAETIASPLSEPVQAASNFDADSRYLVISYSIMPEAVQSQVWLVFDLDYLMGCAHEAERRAAEQKRPATSRLLRDSVMGSSIRVEAVLDKISMTIGECSRLKVGDLIPLPDTDPGSVRLNAETVNGQIEIGHCEMGVWKRQRALKLKQPVLEPFTQEVAKM